MSAVRNVLRRITGSRGEGGVMNNDYVYHSFTKDELVQRCIDLGINRVAMLAERSRLRAELAACRELGSAMENALNTIVVMDRRLSLREREEIATMRRKWFAARKGEGEV